jgi:hypothetical protein
VSTADRLEQFLAFSSEVSGFSVFDLKGTGQARSFLDAVTEVVGPELLDELLDAYAHIGAEGAGRESQLRKVVFSDEKLGPVARNVIKLWYVGIWYALPSEWSDAFGALENDVTFTVSADAYTEGLLWPAIGANPPGAKGPGFASWVGPPRLAPEGPVR